MCACEPGYVCPACRGTRLDDRYLDDEPARDERPPLGEAKREDEGA
jgi:hypothetical protein